MQAIEQHRVLLVAAVETVDRPRHVGEVLQVSGALEILAVHAGRKAQDLRLGVLAEPGDQRGEALDDVLEHAVAAIEPIDPHVEQEAFGEQAVEKIAADDAHGEGSLEVVLEGESGDQGLVQAVHQQHRRRVAVDAIVVDHHLGREDVAVLAADRDTACRS